MGWGRHRGGVLVTTMSDNQLLERSLFGLGPQRLLSNNTVFFTNYLILNTISPIVTVLGCHVAYCRAKSKEVSAYFTTKQILSFGFVEQYRSH